MIDYQTRGRNYETQHEDFHNTDAPNQFPVYGALVGGPQSDDRCVPILLPLLIRCACSKSIVPAGACILLCLMLHQPLQLHALEHWPCSHMD